MSRGRQWPKWWRHWAAAMVALLGLTTARTSSSPTASQLFSLPICSLSGGLHATMRYSGAGGMHYWFFLVYVNSGSAACRLTGTPGVQPVLGPDGTHVGGPSVQARPTAAQGASVALKPRGGAARSSVSAWVADDFPRSQCLPKNTDGVIVHLKGVHAFYLKNPQAPLQVCTNLTLRNGKVVLGAPGSTTFVEGVAGGA